jgi:hypothetical protein
MGNESTLRNFLDTVEARLDVTEPAVIDNGCAVASIAPSKDGLVGLDVDTGRPMRIGWRYKTIEEKPVIINAGAKQTVIPPAAPAPKHPLIPLPPPVKVKAEPKLSAGAIAANKLFDAMKAKFQPSEHPTAADDRARQAFVIGCLEKPEFYQKWKARLDGLERAEEDARRPVEPPDDWPLPPRTRQRIVDT